MSRAKNCNLFSAFRSHLIRAPSLERESSTLLGSTEFFLKILKLRNHLFKRQWADFGLLSSPSIHSLDTFKNVLFVKFSILKQINHLLNSRTIWVRTSDQMRYLCRSLSRCSLILFFFIFALWPDGINSMPISLRISHCASDFSKWDAIFCLSSLLYSSVLFVCSTRLLYSSALLVCSTRLFYSSVLLVTFSWCYFWCSLLSSATCAFYKLFGSLSLAIEEQQKKWSTLLNLPSFPKRIFFCFF